MARLTEEMIIARSKQSDLTAIKKLNCWCVTKNPPQDDSSPQVFQRDDKIPLSITSFRLAWPNLASHLLIASQTNGVAMKPDICCMLHKRLRGKNLL